MNQILLILQSYFSNPAHVREMLSDISGVLFLLGFYSYSKAIIRKETVPVKVTWLVAVALDFITYAGMAQKHTVNAQIVAACVGATFVAALSLKFGASGWKTIDKICAGGALLGIALWIAFGDSNVGIVISCLTMVIACAPMFKATWIDPSKEDKMSWTIFFVSCIFELFAVAHWTIAEAAQPITFTMIELTMVLLVYLRPLAITPRQKTNRVSVNSFEHSMPYHPREVRPVQSVPSEGFPTREDCEGCK